MADHIWLVRQENGDVIGGGLTARTALGEAYAAGDLRRLRVFDAMQDAVDNGDTTVVQDGYTLTREPLPAPLATSEPVACNRKACRAPLPSPRWWNSSTRAYYCDECMHAITRWPENVGFFEDRAHPSAAVCDDCDHAPCVCDDGEARTVNKSVAGVSEAQVKAAAASLYYEWVGDDLEDAETDEERNEYLSLARKMLTAAGEVQP